jgi:alginate O-acetyltransferase complex protein AlgI
LGWLITFNFVNVSFIIFRARDLKEAGHILKGMLGLQGLQIPKLGIKPLLALKEFGAKIGPYMTNDENLQLLLIVLAFVLIFKGKNTLEIETSYQPRTKFTMAIAAMFVLCLFGMNRVSEFIYFNF